MFTFPLAVRRSLGLAFLALVGLSPLYAQQAEAQPAGEPTNAKEAAERKAALDRATDAKYQTWKSTRTPAEQAWLKVLEDNLGGFYLPIYKADKVKGLITAWDYVEDDPKLPRVLLIGDSISRGYTLTVRKELAGKANLHRAPANCGPTATGLKKLDVWLGTGHWDVIHFNFGIHDRATPEATYGANLQAIVDRLRQTGATLIWARTTPTLGDANAEKYSAAQCATLNRLADALMARNQIALNDLFRVVEPRLAELQLPNNVHFKPAGYEVLGQQVAKVIQEALSSPQKR